MGAWIETFPTRCAHFCVVSHPVWVRGLKLRLSKLLLLSIVSHPVWVRGLKLLKNIVRNIFGASHPVWVRGLKQSCLTTFRWFIASHPVWVRGLKPLLAYQKVYNDVAPRVGAWIETLLRSWGRTKYYVAPRVGAWIETSDSRTGAQPTTRRTLCGCVD